MTKYLKFRAGENAIIESWDHTMPMASAMVDEVRRVGGQVLLVHNDEDAWWRAIDRGQTRLLGKSSAPEWAALKAADVYVNFWGPGDADRIEKDSTDALDDAFAWNWPWYGVARKAGLRGVRMTAGFATEGRAKTWGIDRAHWEKHVLEGASSTRTSWPRPGLGSARRSPAGRGSGSPTPTEPTWRSRWPGQLPG